MHGQVEWVRGDMRRVPLNVQFDAVLNLFTSFGYFEDDDENTKVIHEIHRLLAPGGKFVIDFLNPDYVRTRLVPMSERNVDGIHIVERRWLEPEYVKKTIYLREPNEPVRKYAEQVRLYNPHEFEDMFQSAGLALETIYGDYDRSPFTGESPRMILVGHKASRSG